MDTRGREHREHRASEHGVMDQAGQKAGETAHQAQQKAGETAHQVQQKAGEAGAQVQAQAKPRLEHQREMAADQIGGIAHALRETGRQLREENQTGIARYADKGAERIEQFAEHIRENDLNQLVRETQQFARRQPALFLAGAFTLGFLGARFFKGAGQQEGSDRGRSHR